MKNRIFSSLMAMLLCIFCLENAQAQDNTLYDHVSLQNPPTYPGGIKKFYEFFVANIKYPTLASEKNIQGTTYVTYVIEKDGSLSDIKIEGRKLGYGLDDEAIRVLKLSRKWNPGQLNGKPVRVKYNIPVKFTMPNKKLSTTTEKVPNKAGRPAARSVNENTVYDHVSLETPPSYPGGIQKFYTFLGQNMKYPKEAIQNNVQGTTHLIFTIETDGSLSDVRTEGRKVGYGTDEEAIRVVKSASKWNPGQIDGKAVRVRYALPIKFTLPKKKP